MDWWQTFSTGWWGNITAGLVSGGLVSVVFYLLSGRQLRKEATRLRSLNNQITRALEEAGMIKFNRDPSGEAVGIVLERRIG